MSHDIGKFLMFVAIIMAAFTSGLGTLYGYYRGAVHKDPETGEVTVQEDSFVTVADTFRTLFWGIFCMTPPEAADVVVADAAAGTASATPSLNDTQQPHLTQARIATTYIKTVYLFFKPYMFSSKVVDFFYFFETLVNYLSTGH